MRSQRRLPHIWDKEHPIFLTWRLHGSLPPHRVFSGGKLPSGRLSRRWIACWTKRARGRIYFRQPALADIAVEAIDYNARSLGHYDLHAFVVMPNHVHLLATAHVDLPKLNMSLKGITAKRANAILGLTGTPFWQEESYDHLVRDQREFHSIRRYIEHNPVRAGLVQEASQYRWSSAWATRGSPADQGVRPTGVVV